MGALEALLFVVLSLSLGTARGFSFRSDLKPSEIAIMQFDSRAPTSYWEASALWNNRYCHHHGHRFLYYSSNENCRYDSTVLADPWCKVLSMIQSTHDHPSIRAFVYMDSDAVIDKGFFNTSLNEMLETVREKLDWDVIQKPVLFNQDGPCWWCNLVSKVGYSMCLNAGTVVWLRHPTSSDVLQKWWHSSQDDYETNPLKRKFRTAWPWEQDRQMAVYNTTSDKIQVSSQPETPFMRREKGSQLVSGGWCLSHLPRSGCFISHFCANHGSKALMDRKYRELLREDRYQLRDSTPASEELEQYYLRF